MQKVGDSSAESSANIRIDTRPSASTLTEDQRAKTFNSDLLKFNCDGTYNADHGVNTNQVNLRVKAFNNQNVSSIKKYGSEGSGKNLPFSSLSDDLEKKDKKKKKDK